MRNWIVSIAFLFFVVCIVKMVIGFLVGDWILSGTLAAISIGVFFNSSRNDESRFYFLPCGALWLANAILPLVMGYSQHQILLFLLAALSLVALIQIRRVPSYPGKAKGMPDARFRWTPRLRWGLVMGAACLGFALVAWNDYSWWSVLNRASGWDTYAVDAKTISKGPVVVIETNLYPQGWLERELHVGRFPKISGINGDSALKDIVTFASRPEDARMVILLAYSYGGVGTYMKDNVTYGSAYQSGCSVYLLDMVSHQRREIAYASGAAPPSTSGGGPEYGDLPEDEDLIQSIHSGWKVASNPSELAGTPAAAAGP